MQHAMSMQELGACFLGFCTKLDSYSVVRAGVLEGIFSVGMLFLGWRTLIGARKAVQKLAVPQKKPNSA